MREATLTAQILRYLKSRGCFAVKWHGSRWGIGGIPDIYTIVLCRYGHAFPVHIEVKAPGKTPTPRQRKVMRQLHFAGAVVFWTDSLDDVMYVVETLQEVGSVVINEKSGRIYRPQ
jgi:hypothetical protein